MIIKIKRKKKRLKLKSNFIFDREQAIKFCKIEYYEAQAKNIKAYEFMEKEKSRLSTPKWEKVTKLLEYYKELGDNNWKSTPGKILTGIYNKNREGALLEKSGKPNLVCNTNLIKIISDPQTLLLAYKAIKGNKGAMTAGAKVSQETFYGFTPKQRELYLKSITFPDKFSLKDVLITSELLSKGLYPWGSSLRVYVPKPGSPDKLRPITIPPFLDRVVQKAISMILEAIYEPYFEVQNRSFGFRPNKGTHDAIVAVTSNYSAGKITAIEGDVEAAYDTVNKEKLLNILGKKITDRKFLTLIKERLDYDFVEKTETGELRVRPTRGIPQGGIDSPYLFNIYMKELDNFIHTEVQKFADSLNEKLTIKRSFKKLFNSLVGQTQKMNRKRSSIKQKIKDCSNESDIQDLRNQLYKTIKETRLIRHKKNHIKSEHPHRRIIKILYVRYADDWILLTNANKQIAGIMKNMISDFLISTLDLRLSEKKTFITDIRDTPAKFLGFEIRHPKIGMMIKKPLKLDFPKGKRYNLQRQTGSAIIWANVDRQRLISRFHMKGFCDKYGSPKEMPWISCMEPQVIIERYNAIIRGLAEFYYGFIRNESSLQRWIYILRYSCIKTLAQKYRTSIKGIIKKFGIDNESKSYSTVQVNVVLKVRDDVYTKSWKLWTYKGLMKELKKKNIRRKVVQTTFWDIEKDDKLGNYPLRDGKIPAITNEDYLDNISWVSLRTQASFAMPCSNCGTDDDVQQHHVRHIRKTAYELISKDMPYKQVLSLRNRKQIPLCAKCHKNLVHTGKYSGTALIKLVPTRLVDNRTLHVESFVKKGIEYNSKSLIARGWKLLNKKDA